MSSNPPIIPRSNPLTRKFDEIAQINAEHGTRAEGGGAPIVPDAPAPVPAAGGGIGVLPPDPTPLTPEEEAQLKADFEAQWGDGSKANEPIVTTARQFIPAPGKVPAGFAAIDLVNKWVVALDGSRYPINDREHTELMQFAFQKMLVSLEDNVKKVAEGLGIQWPPQPKEPPREAVSQVSGDQTSQPVGNEPPSEERAG